MTAMNSTPAHPHPACADGSRLGSSVLPACFDGTNGSGNAVAYAAGLAGRIGARPLVLAVESPVAPNYRPGIRRTWTLVPRAGRAL